MLCYEWQREIYWANFLEGWRFACTSRTFCSHSCLLDGKCKGRGAEWCSCAADTLWSKLQQSDAKPHEIKWRKGREKIKLKKKREQIKPRGYITLSKWSKSLIEHRQGSLRNLSFFLYKWNINKLTRSEVSQTFSPFCRFFALFFSPDWVLVATDYQVTGLALRIAANYLVSACCSTV